MPGRTHLTRIVAMLPGQADSRVGNFLGVEHVNVSTSHIEPASGYNPASGDQLASGSYPVSRLCEGLRKNQLRVLDTECPATHVHDFKALDMSGRGLDLQGLSSSDHATGRCRQSRRRRSACVGSDISHGFRLLPLKARTMTGKRNRCVSIASLPQSCLRSKAVLRD